MLQYWDTIEIDSCLWIQFLAWGDGPWSVLHNWWHSHVCREDINTNLIYTAYSGQQWRQPVFISISLATTAQKITLRKINFYLSQTGGPLFQLQITTLNLWILIFLQNDRPAEVAPLKGSKTMKWIVKYWLSGLVPPTVGMYTVEVFCGGKNLPGKSPRRA